MRFLFLSTLCIFVLLPLSVNAQDALFKNSDEPLEITADGSLEWHRNDNVFIAKKQALAKQGNVSISSDILTADYNDDTGNNLEIWRVRGNGNVILTSQNNKAYSDKALYDLTKSYAEMTGKDLRLVSPDQTVTAEDKFEYWIEDGRLEAIGNATVTRKNEQGEINTLSSDKIIAYLKDNDDGERVIERLEAINNVVIKTPTETLTGKKGIYTANTNMAEITGGVTIIRGPNTLEGERAQVDLSTNISKMFGGTTPNSRVKAIFYPGSEKKN